MSADELDTALQVIDPFSELLTLIRDRPQSRNRPTPSDEDLLRDWLRHVQPESNPDQRFFRACGLMAQVVCRLNGFEYSGSDLYYYSEYQGSLERLSGIFVLARNPSDMKYRPGAPKFMLVQEGISFESLREPAAFNAKARELATMTAKELFLSETVLKPWAYSQDFTGKAR